MSDDRLAIHALGPVWGAPSPSPFVIKVLTWLRMADVPHHLVPLKRPPRSKTGKIPYATWPDGRMVSDSGAIIDAVAQERGIDLDAGLDPQQRAIGHLARRTLEEHLYFTGLYERFATPEGFARTSVDYFKAAPWPLRSLAPHMVRRNAKRNLFGQGMGRLSREEITARGRSDLAAISTILGDRPFLLGDRPTTVDATMTGFLWAYDSNPFPSALTDALRATPNLVAYLARMRERYWSDFSGSD